jgi:hypothetical protein
MSAIRIWELLSYVVTVVGLPLAIYVFIFEQRKERDNEEEEVYQPLSDNYRSSSRSRWNTPTCACSPAKKLPHFQPNSASACSSSSVC